MKNLWNKDVQQQYPSDLEQRVYSSRLLGANPDLVLHGGGNTSVKITETNLVGETEEILYVKGSGWDLATIEAPGFTPIRMDHLLKLAELEILSDLEMVNEMKTHQTIASAPTGSVEAILHAVLPYKFVDHTHADAIVTITNSTNGEAKIRDLFADELVIIPYVMPGFDLARLVATEFKKQATEKTRGMILMNHGIFSFADTAQAAYDIMIDLVNRAEAYLQQQNAWDIDVTPKVNTPDEAVLDIAQMRADLSQVVAAPMILSRDQSEATLSFCQRADMAEISQRGPATPDHVIRTKRLPMVGNKLNAYVSAYRTYFADNEKNARAEVSMLDPAPRVILDPKLGMLTLGKTAAEAQINADIYQHTMQIIQRAEKLGGWNALSAAEIFEVEYWELEQAKLRKSSGRPEFQGEIALVTGAASGIGKACVESLLKRGAAVVGLDLADDVSQTVNHQAYLGIRCDVTDKSAVKRALEQAVNRFGGIDMLVLNAGMFPGGTAIANLDDDLWDQVMSVNLDANMRLMRDCYPYLALAPNKGRMVIIGSKNVLAPGPGAAAYSASKAALNQLARIAALEWADKGIRVNSLHPDAVFDTGLWTDEVLEARAAHYGLTVHQYKTKNLLKTEVTSADVAELAAAMCGALFAKTTASQVPVDGGNDRVV